MSAKQSDEIRTSVRKSYASVAQAESGCCAGPDAACCAPPANAAKGMSRKLGYSEEELAAVPEGANMGLGCGNPTAIASLKAGETVIDLGSGGGFDCFIAAEKVGPQGRIIGVDMTPEMVSKARRNAETMQAANVEFRLGEIEHLPVADEAADVIVSNCVINLSPEKAAVYREAYRVLKSGGRLCISDVVATAPLPDALRQDMAMVSGCIGGAAEVEQISQWLAAAGFHNVHITLKEESRTYIKDWAPEAGIEDYIVSATIEATKP
jgi:arsenite methyltransferase